VAKIAFVQLDDQQDSIKWWMINKILLSGVLQDKDLSQSNQCINT
jgi:hypothetical protein